MRGVFILIGVLLASLAFAQVDYLGNSRFSKRFSLRPSLGLSYFLLGDKGYLEVDRDGIVEDKVITRTVKFFDNAGELQNEYTFSLDEDFYTVNGYLDELGPYLLVKSAYNKLIILHLRETEYTKDEITFIKTIGVRNFDVINNKAIIGGTLGSGPMFYQYDLETKGLSPFEALYNTRKTFLQSKVDLEQGVITLFSEEKSIYNIMNFSLEGQLISNQDLIDGTKDKVIRKAKVSGLINGKQYVIGTYSDLGTQLFTGFYAIQYDLNGKSKSKFTPYFKLERFFEHLPDEREERVKSRAKSKWERRGTWSTAMDLFFKEPFFRENYAAVTAMCFNGPYKNIYSVGLDLKSLEFKILDTEDLRQFIMDGEISKKDID